jgi:4-amino-4-deoxy-L-arabinose transferase-like glycosyltransferase
MAAQEEAVRSDHHLRTLGWVILALGAVGIVLLWDAHGISWDEHTRSQHGERILSYFLSLGTDRSVNEETITRLYTALPDFISAGAYRAFPEWQYAIRHTVSALFALATLPALFRYAKLMGEPWAGPLASLALLSMPVFFGHSFVNSKDIPLACAFAWAMLALAWLFQENRFTWRRIVLAGVGLGFPLTIRPGVWPLLMGFVLVAMLYSDVVRKVSSDQRYTRRSASKVLGLVVVSWTVMVVVWPWAHENPLLHPMLGVAAAGSFPTVIHVLFDGALHVSDALPRRYLLQMISIKTPSAILMLALVGLVLGGMEAWRERKGNGLTWFLAGAWLLVPIAAWSLLTPNLYDGIRHFLFVLPALSLWAAVGALKLIRSMPKPSLKVAATLVVVGAMAWPISDIVRLHPYQMTYFNGWVGGLEGAEGRYETEYWVTSYREAAEWISRQPVAPRDSHRVLVAGDESASQAAAFFLPDDAVVCTTWQRWAEAELPPSFDFYLATTRHEMDQNFPDSPVVFSVGRDGATFSVVRGHPSPHSDPP